MVNVLFLNSSGNGFGENCCVENNTTVAKFLTDKLGEFNPRDWKIRVNRKFETSDKVLVEGDRLSCTANKIEGAQVIS